MKKRKNLQRFLLNPRNVSFSDAVNITLLFGFVLDRTSGSHHIFKHSGIPELLNLQNVGGRAKPYQMKQLIGLIEKYNLRPKEQK